MGFHGISWDFMGFHRCLKDDKASGSQTWLAGSHGPFIGDFPSKKPPFSSGNTVIDTVVLSPNWVIFWANVDKYASTMEHMGHHMGYRDYDKCMGIISSWYHLIQS